MIAACSRISSGARNQSDFDSRLQRSAGQEIDFVATGWNETPKGALTVFPPGKRADGDVEMAIYHLTVKHIQRSKGRSAVAAAAYRCGGVLWDDRQGIRFDYRGRRLDVVSTAIMIPTGAAADWATDRQRLWNAVERDPRKNARTATEVEVALPAELSDKQRDTLVDDFAQELANTYRIAVDAAIHKPRPEVDADQPDDSESAADVRGPGKDPRNHHAHLLCSTWTIASDGPGEKVRLFPEEPDVKALRARWEGYVNRALEQAGHGARVDHRSYKDQGLDIIPTRHIGPTATGMEARGIETDRGNAWLVAKVAQRRQRALLSANSPSTHELARPSPPTPAKPAPPDRPPAEDDAETRVRATRRQARIKEAEGARDRLNCIHRYHRDEWRRRQRWKGELLRRQLDGQLPPELEFQIAWLRRRDEDARGYLIAKLVRGARVLDEGDAVRVQGPHDQRAVALAVAMAKAHGWNVIQVTGTVEFRRAVAAAAEKAGMMVFDPVLRRELTRDSDRPPPSG